LSKPFHTAELIARLHALLRRSNARPHGPLRVAGLELDEETPKRYGFRHRSPFRFDRHRIPPAALLHAAPRPVLSKTRLAEHVYDFDTERDSNVLEVYINRLRRKLGRDLIATRRGQGYVRNRRHMTSLQARLSAGLILALDALMALAVVIGGYSLRQLAEDFVASRLEHDLETVLAALTFDASGHPQLAADRIGAPSASPIQGTITGSKLPAAYSVPARCGTPSCPCRRSPPTAPPVISSPAHRISNCCWSGARFRVQDQPSPSP
jgi:hypothetical protein